MLNNVLPFFRFLQRRVEVLPIKEIADTNPDEKPSDNKTEETSGSNYEPVAKKMKKGQNKVMNYSTHNICCCLLQRKFQFSIVVPATSI